MGKKKRIKELERLVDSLQNQIRKIHEFNLSTPEEQEEWRKIRQVTREATKALADISWRFRWPIDAHQVLGQTGGES